MYTNRLITCSVLIDIRKHSLSVLFLVINLNNLIHFILLLIKMSQFSFRLILRIYKGGNMASAFSISLASTESSFDILCDFGWRELRKSVHCFIYIILVVLHRRTEFHVSYKNSDAFEERSTKMVAITGISTDFYISQMFHLQCSRSSWGSSI